ncbi:MAG: hypothetical protein GC180_03650 [Bacteroidetes bacterium]|nr:hypothetical protein [Bacteroidota bacterium]
MLTKNVNASTLSPEQVWDIMNSGRINEVKVRRFWTNNRHYFLFLLAFGMGALMMLFLSNKSGESERMAFDAQAAASIMPAEPVKPEFSRENLFNEIQEIGILCPKVVYAQAELESAFLSAGSSVKTNNLFGMRYPGQRPTKAVGLYLQGKDTIIYGNRAELRPYLTRPTYAVYAHWTDAVADYKLWQDYSFKTRQKYIEFLSRVYATAPEYANRIQEMVSQR